MKLYYYSAAPNFGDALNTWLWERLLPGCWNSDDGINFSGIGTIVTSAMPEAHKWIVFTSGAGYGVPPAHFGDQRWHVVAVRGPLSAAALDLPAKAAVSDGAMLLAALDGFAPLPENERHGVVFMPHHGVDADIAWQDLCESAGIEYLSPRGDSRVLVERLRGARLVLADAMHAAIVADTLRVPWIPVVSSPESNTFKWLDWTRSLELPYAPVRLPAASGAALIRNRTRWLSGNHHSFDGVDEAAALAHFRRQRRMREAGWWNRARRFGNRIDIHLRRGVRRPPLRELLEAHDRARHERTAAALAAAPQGPAFMSDDRVFAERLETLVSRLDEVRALAAAGAS